MSEPRYDAVVCGAGAGGLAAARALGGLGLRVLLLDRLPQPPRRIAKGEVLQPGALRVLRRWGVDRQLDAAGGVRLSHLVVRTPDGAPRMSLDYGQLPDGDRTLLAHDHTAILDALAEGLPPTVAVRRGTAVDALLHDEQQARVAGVRLADGSEVHAPLTVAADGIASRLRRTAGIAGTRIAYPHRLVSYELDRPADLPAPADFSAYLSDRGLRLVYPLPGDRIRLYLQIRPDELRGLDASSAAAHAARAVRELPALAPLADAVEASAATRQLFGVGRFLAERTAVPGLALVGEAAYAVHPMAAQGMNTAITSAASLADRLGEWLREDAPDAPGTGALSPVLVDAALRAYEAERLPILTAAARTSDAAARMVTELRPLPRLLGRRAVRCTGANPRLRHTVTTNMAGLGPRRLTLLDRFQQLGLLPDPRAHRTPVDRENERGNRP